MAVGQDSPESRKAASQPPVERSVVVREWALRDGLCGMRGLRLDGETLVPDLDAEPLDLVGEQKNRFRSGAHLLTAVGRLETRSPAADRLELLVVHDGASSCLGAEKPSVSGEPT